LNVPPEPPLLTSDAVHALLREVALLLDYLNRLPEPRLNRYFGSAAAQVLAIQTPLATPIPPCGDLSYFLGRIATIAARGKEAPPTVTTQPDWFKDLPEPSPPAPDGTPQELKPTTLPGSRLGDLAFLIWTRDFLTSVAAPATLDTIRVTRAYRAHRATRAVPGDEKARHTADERDLFMAGYGVRIARQVTFFIVLTFGLLWCSLYVSYLVYWGQMLLVENAALRAEYAAHETRLKEAAGQEEVAIQAALRAEQASDLPLLARSYCDLRAPLPADYKIDVVRISTTPPTERSILVARVDDGRSRNLRLYISERQRALCTEYKTLKQRRDELVMSHRFWWRTVVPLYRLVLPVRFGSDRPSPDTAPNHSDTAASKGVTSSQPSLRSRASEWHLETFRYQMQQLINGWLAGIMPAMYAALGALASLFRRLSLKIGTERLAPADYGGMWISLVLGILTGAVIGLFTSALPQTGQSVGLPLSTTALALLAGYATERVFGLFDGLADRVFVTPGQRTALAS
jgi:hypothetical protein